MLSGMIIKIIIIINFFFFFNMAYMRNRLISVVTKNLKKVDRLEAEILAHKVAKKGKKSHGRLDPTLRMREVVHTLYRVPRVQNHRRSI